MNKEKFTSFQKVFDTLSITIISELSIGSISYQLLNLEIPSWFIFLVTSIFVLNCTEIYQSYRIKTLFVLLKRLLIGWIIIISTITLIMHFSNKIEFYPKFQYLIWSFLVLSTLFINHIISRKLIRYSRQRGNNYKTILYWGKLKYLENLFKYLNENSWIGLKIVSWFSPDNNDINKNFDFIPNCSGSFNEMESWLKKNTVDLIIFSDLSKKSRLLKLFGNYAIPVSYAPEWAENSMRFSSDKIGSQYLINLWGINYSNLDLLIKKLFDFIFSLIGIIILSPIFLIISILIYIDSPGKIFFKQERSGVNGKPFKIFKFRTMKVMDSGLKSDLKQVKKNDPRLTVFGKFLREWSLDELPQLINVLRGEMSIVGPRPHAIVHNEIYRKKITGYMQRHAMKPGITGLAQISGFRGETREILDMQKRIEADLNYQSDWNLYLDIKILIKTIMFIKSSKAY